jgi:hypothetical protein
MLWSGWFSRHIYQDYQIYQNNYVVKKSPTPTVAKNGNALSAMW